jgi:hypothetical protein
MVHRQSALHNSLNFDSILHCGRPTILVAPRSIFIRDAFELAQPFGRNLSAFSKQLHFPFESPLANLRERVSCIHS